MRREPLVLIAAAALVPAAIAARPLTYSAPAETTPAELADAEGELVVNACSTCHSLEYIVTQPRGKGAQFWKDSVAKMVNVYKAPVEPADADAVAAALARKFG
ncbi:cytochrome C [Novosphingobium jiangmenense]|uniref:Cytochrome C n=1 Tax=Novosphingobium jiangmenense TaxID=2791981 RepID=A0ABS0HJA6_9SPHN|nr:cytochrome C [Novosphingobium jiangmenense]MBF9152318.1 cytochrome C [Novosphingobium jiangmenense]